MVVLSWIMTATISMKIACLMLVTIPILGGALIFIAKKAHPHFIQVFDEYDVLNNTVQENVNAARVVKAYVREDHENEKFHKISQKVFDLFTRAEMIVAWNSPVMNFGHVHGGASDRADRRRRHRLWHHADRRADQYHGICHADPDVR